MGTLTGAVGSAAANRLFGVFGRPFIESVAGKEIVSIASTAAAIEANALVEGHALTGDQWVQNLLLGHGQGKVQHVVGEWSEKTYGPSPATPPTATTAVEQPGVRADDVHKRFDVSDTETGSPKPGGRDGSEPTSGPGKPIAEPESTPAPKAGVEPASGSGATAARGLASVRAARALETATPRARQLAAQLAPLFDRWANRTAEQRLLMLVEFVNEHILRPRGVPDVHPDFGARGAAEDGRMVAGTWDLQVRASLLQGRAQTPEQFAAACEIAVHEAYHALQLFRAARTNLVMADGRLPREVWEAARDANSRTRPAERFTPGSPEYTEASAVRESLWNSGRQHNRAVYARLEAADAAVGRAIQQVQAAHGRPPGDLSRAVAAREFWEARAARERAHDEYMRLPEEVEAWRIGRETRAALRERLRLDRFVERARISERQAMEAERRAERPFIAALLHGDNEEAARLGPVRDRARDQRVRAQQLLNDLMYRRLTLATTGRPP